MYKPHLRCQMQCMFLNDERKAQMCDRTGLVLLYATGELGVRILTLY